MTDALRRSLRRLDYAIEKAAARMRAERPDTAQDAFRGLYIDPPEVERLLKLHPGEPALWSGGLPENDSPAGEPMDWLRETFLLSSFDVDVLLIALAPELDLRYERLYGFLQDDVTRRRPTVDLALNLLCATAEEKVRRRTHFAPDSPLAVNELMRLVPDPGQVEPPLLAQYLKIDEQILSLLIGQQALDPRLAPYCRYIQTGRATADPRFSALAESVRLTGQPLRLYFQGPDRVAKLEAAQAMAEAAGAPLLAADLKQAPESAAKLAVREASLRGAVLYAEGLDALPDGRGIAILAGTQPTSWPGTVVIRFGSPDFPERVACWREQLAEAGISLPAAEMASLGSRFVLTTGQIREAAQSVRHRAALRGGAGCEPVIEDLFACGRAESGHALAALARKVEPRHCWRDIVLPPDVLVQLGELCSRAALGHRILKSWGFDRKMSLGRGVTALFTGPSGTGKTLAAEIVAGELQLDLYKIDLSGVVSKYIGETEKNLDRIFAAAENSNAILFFDEADALFGKRSEVRDSHDRYANIEIAYLLQKMEEHQGVAILATNLRQNLDESFTRRLTFSLSFPFPDEASRLHIWEGVWPPEAPLAEDVDLRALARSFKVSGGNIRNIALAAAFLAAQAESKVTMNHLLHATRREYQKLGKQLNAMEALMEAAS